MTQEALFNVGQEIIDSAASVFARLAELPDEERMDTINAIRQALHQHSPMQADPVDCVLWVPADRVEGNEYNPNVVAPPEMRLLERSIEADGYTQPIVAWPVDGGYEVVDGFHRHRIGKESQSVRKRVNGRLPITVIRADRTDEADRRAATIRHNRARGVHTVDGMAEMVLWLHRTGKSDEWIASELGMDPDEVLRLRQTQGLAELFADQEFSEAWEVTYDPEAANSDPGIEVLG